MTAQGNTKESASNKDSWAPPTAEISGFSGGNYYSTPSSPQLCPGSLEGFLLDRALQEKVFLDFNYTIFKLLRTLGAINKNSTKQEIAGCLATAWLAGIGQMGPLNTLAPQPISAADLQTVLNMNPKNYPGNGLVGLLAWWKMAGNDPSKVPGTDPLGKNSYTYYLLGSRSQP